MEKKVESMTEEEFAEAPAPQVGRGVDKRGHRRSPAVGR